MAVEIAGKTIVITGASSGIGEAAARRLAQLGAHVCLVARREAELVRLRDEIIAAGGKASSHPADLSNEAGVDACLDAILAEHPRVDILVNNAGRSIRRTVKESLDRYHDYQRTIQLNYFAPVRIILRLLPQMMERHEGQIINVSSMAALIPTPYYSAYAGSKSALDGFSKSLRAELVDKGVHVTVINFPLVKTAMTAPTKVYRYLRQMDVTDAGDWIVRAIEKHPMRLTSPLGNAWGAAAMVMPGTTTDWTGRMFRYMGRRLQKRVEKEAGAATE